MTKPSYHNLHITTGKMPRTPISALPFGIDVRCCRTSGWQVWDMTYGGGVGVLMAGEYDLNKWLVLDVDGYVIVDSRKLSDMPEPTKEHSILESDSPFCGPDSPFYNKLCTKCGATDAVGDDRLQSPCSGSNDVPNWEAAYRKAQLVERQLAEADLAKTRFEEPGVPIGGEKGATFFYENGVVASDQLTKGDGSPGSSTWLDLLSSGGEVRWRKS